MTESALTLRELFESALALTGADVRRTWQRTAAILRCVRPWINCSRRHCWRGADSRSSLRQLARHHWRCGTRRDIARRGRQVGPFTLLDKLGEGGSSVVFRAEREQAGVRQVVALKLLRNGLYSRDEQMNFRHERLALSRLRHPGIARLIEGDVTTAGIPYIALELIEGAPITNHVRDRTPGPAPASGLVRRCLPRGGSSTSRADRASRSETVECHGDQ